jgi:hypothetical protein
LRVIHLSRVWTDGQKGRRNAKEGEPKTRLLEDDAVPLKRSLLPIRRGPPTMKVMKNRAANAFSYSVFYEQATEGGDVALVPALPGCQTQGPPKKEAT